MTAYLCLTTAFPALPGDQIGIFSVGFLVGRKRLNILTLVVRMQAIGGLLARGFRVSPQKKRPLVALLCSCSYVIAVRLWKHLKDNGEVFYRWSN